MEEIEIPCKFIKDVSLKDKTWIHRGGMVNYWLQPQTIEELVSVGKKLYQDKESFVPIGYTSNTYFKNGFNIKYVIDTRLLKRFCIIDDKTLLCECGAPMSKVSQYCVEKGISRYEGMIGLPGAVGGAIYCNSGCYDCGIDKTLIEIELLTEQGEIIKVSAEKMKYEFRTSAMKRGELNGIILRAYFDISKREDSNILQSIANKNSLNRKQTQDPPTQNLGSTFNYTGYKRGLRNNIIKNVMRVYSRISKDTNKRYLVRKRITCLIYNKMSIFKYISDKRMNCFIWKDDGADAAYPKYMEMMRRIYSDVDVEIITME